MSMVSVSCISSSLFGRTSDWYIAVHFYSLHFALIVAEEGLEMLHHCW